jgi:creatinine amidohydrolase
VLIVNGHGGNSVAGGIVNEWMMDHPDSRVKWHDWWNAPKTWEQVLATDPNGSHASWMENFPWTRLANVPAPDGSKPMIDMAKLRVLTPEGKREYVGDGNMGGVYQRSDEEMLAIWESGVKETRALLEGGWE